MKLSTVIRSFTLFALLSTAMAGTASAVQQAWPDADNQTGAWSTAPLWSKINAPGATTNFITTSTDNSTFEVSLQPMSTPSDGGASCNLIITQQSSGSGGPERYNWAILNGDGGATLLSATNVAANRGAWQTSTIGVDLSASPPTSWGNIAVAITSASLGAGESLFVAALRLECADPSAAAAPTLSLPAVTGIDTTFATLGATITSDGGDTITERGTVWNTTGAPITQNILAEGGTATGAFSHLRGTGDGTGTPMPAGTLVYFRGYATNGTGTGYSPDNSFYTEPTAATGVTIDNITGNSMRINWTNGSNTTALVLVKQGSAVNAPPADGTSYTASTTFGSGSQIGAGNYVVFAGSGTTVTISGLAASTTYHVAVYAYAGSGAPINYQQDSPAIGNATTTVGVLSPPALSATTAYWTQLNVVSSVKDTTAKLGATIDSDGNDTISERGIVWSTSDNTPMIGEPGVTTAAGSGTTTGIFSVNVTGLPPASLVYFSGYATNSQGTSYSPVSSFYTEPNGAAAPTINAPSGTNYFDLTVNYTKPANADGVLVVAKSSYTLTTPPYDGLEYTADSRFGSGDSTEPGCILFCEYVVASDNASGSVNVTGLKDNTKYYFAVYAYKGSGAGITGINYVQTITASLPATTDTVPAAGKSHNELYVAQGGAGGTMTSADCANCHGVHHTSQLLPTGLDMYNKCFVCHQAGGAADPKINIGMHLADGSVDCGTCHTMHSFSEGELYSTDHGGTSGFNRSFVRANMAKYLNTANGFAVDALEPTVFQTRPDDFAFASGDSPYNAVCQTCHNPADGRTTHHNQAGTDDHHISGGVAENCISCHAHKSTDEYNAFEPSGGHAADFGKDATCTVCHDPAGTKNVVSDIHGGTCSICHSGSPSSSNEKEGDPASGIDGDARLANGTAAAGTWTSQTCLTCHPVATYPMPAVHHDRAEATSGSCVTCHMPNVGVQSPLANRSDIMMPPNLACNWCHLWWPNNTDYIDQGTDSGYNTSTVPGKVMIYRLTWDPVTNQRAMATIAPIPSHAISENATTPINDYGACFACHGATGVDNGRIDAAGQADMIRPFHGLGQPVTAAVADNAATGDNTIPNRHVNNFFAGPQQTTSNGILKTDPYHPAYAALNFLALDVGTNQGGGTKPYANESSSHKFIHDSERNIRGIACRNTAIGSTTSSIQFNNWGPDLGGVGSITVNSGGVEGSTNKQTIMPLVNLSLPTNIGPQAGCP